MWFDSRDGLSVRSSDNTPIATKLACSCPGIAALQPSSAPAWVGVVELLKSPIKGLQTMGTQQLGPRTSWSVSSRANHSADAADGVSMYE